ncbi:ABC transporter C-terminal domain-containing protein [Niabella sp. W65]|nr:ABC transporter C-terminal domain-containing protein [Niabella sp. W65]MCH7362154.1 ABC transporter C-terminal domain-containing protein [Niabella sp. W65]ULT45898.1 ABC transporter C-terminal domain-containing protein [Niabella sp. I65]
MTPDSSQATVKPAATPSQSNPVEKKKVSFKEKREFELLQKEMEDLNKEKEAITKQLNDGSLPYEELQKLANRIGELSDLLDEKELRWLELSELIEG